MKINTLRASFGKLNNESISFHEGLNVIFAPNESGKSTWCAFIRAMLYGVDSSERARSGFLPDKQRYAPWSGVPMEGSMELSIGGCDITISRSTLQPNAPMKEFSAVYTGTDEKVKGIDSANCGEQLTGVTADVFRRSAFIEQGASAVRNSPELERRIQSILSTGEEETSYSEADEQLKKWLRKRKFNGKGKIPQLEERTETGKQKLRDMEDTSSAIMGMETHLAELEEKCTALESEVTTARRHQREEILEKISTTRAELQSAAEARSECLNEINEKKDAIRKSVFNSRDMQDVEREADEDMQRLEELSAERQLSNSPILTAVFFLLTFAGMAVYEFVFSHYWLILTTAVLGLTSVILLLRNIRRGRAISRASEETAAILRKYSTDSEEFIIDRLDAYHALNRGLESAQARALETRERYEAAAGKLQQLEQEILEDINNASGNSEAAVLSHKLSECRRETAALSSEIATQRGRLVSMGDPVVIRAGITSDTEELEKLKSEYDAISLAQEVLREADGEIRSRFSPELGKTAAKYMSAVTDGRYEEILLNRDFSAKARTEEDTIARDSGYLSAGTVDLLYIAVRLAVCELALPSGEPCPLIIDDALVNLDDTRFEQAMKLLRKIAKERQVILFTCRK